MTPKEWAESVGGKVLFHVDSCAVGKLEKLYDAETEFFCSGPDMLPVKHPVAKLDTGHALLARPDSFVVLTPAAARFYEAIQQGFAGVVRVAALGAKANGVDMDQSILLVRAALAAQSSALAGRS